MKTETLDLATPEGRAALAALGVRRTRGRATRPDIPSAPRSERTGLGPLISPTRESGRPAWSYAMEVGKGHRLYVINDPTLDTGWCASEVAAVQVAKELSR